MDQLLPLEEFMDFIGMPEIRELEERFGDEEVRPSPSGFSSVRRWGI
jgi:hypothetical protein